MVTKEKTTKSQVKSKTTTTKKLPVEKRQAREVVKVTPRPVVKKQSKPLVKVEEKPLVEKKAMPITKKEDLSVAKTIDDGNRNKIKVLEIEIKWRNYNELESFLKALN